MAISRRQPLCSVGSAKTASSKSRASAPSMVTSGVSLRSRRFLTGGVFNASASRRAISGNSCLILNSARARALKAPDWLRLPRLAINRADLLIAPRPDCTATSTRSPSRTVSPSAIIRFSWSRLPRVAGVIRNFLPVATAIPNRRFSWRSRTRMIAASYCVGPICVRRARICCPTAGARPERRLSLTQISLTAGALSSTGRA